MKRVLIILLLIIAVSITAKLGLGLGLGLNRSSPATGDGLIHDWTFDQSDASGNYIVDIIGGVNLPMQEAPTFTTDQHFLSNTAVEFDADTNCYADFGEDKQLTNGSHTIVMWIKLASFGGYLSSDVSTLYYIKNNTNAQIYYRNNSNNQFNTVNELIPTNEYYQLVITCDSSESLCYLNGIAMSTGTTNYGDYYLRYFMRRGSTRYAGNLSSLQIYDEVKDFDWIKSNYKEERGEVITRLTCIGNSLTYGTGASGGTTTYPYVLGDSLGITVSNKGTGSNTTTQMLARYVADCITNKIDSHHSIWGGINDLASDPITSDITSNLQAMYNLASDDGTEVIALLIAPYKGVGGSWTSSRQATLDSVNTWITNTANNVDYVIDTYTLLENTGTDSLDLAYDSGDGIHLNDAGYLAVANLIYDTVQWTIGEEVTNGGFDDSDSWSISVGSWSIGSGVATYDDVANDVLSNSGATFTTGTRYLLTFDVADLSSGSAYLKFANQSNSALFGSTEAYSNGSQEVVFTSLADGTALNIIASASLSGSSFTIDNVSIKELF